MRGFATVVVLACLAACAVLLFLHNREGEYSIRSVKLQIGNTVGDMRTFESVSAALVAVAVTGSLRPTYGAWDATVWPTPAQMTIGSGALSIDSSFSISCGESGVCPDPLPFALGRYTGPLLFTAGAPSDTPYTVLDSCTVTVAAEAPLTIGVDESYTLSVIGGDSPACEITASTQWGAIRGLESLSQLVQWQPTGSSGSGGAYSIYNSTIAIKDAPRFKWRGHLIDTARHFLTVGGIKHTLDAMSYNKYNVLHWHIMDDQSWPLISTTYPRFTELGAFHAGATYSHDDVVDIVTYAWNRGIMVVPEFDMPAHATVWGIAYPNLTITCPPGVTGEVLLDPTGPVYPVFTALLQEYIPLFNTTTHIHIGGDEVWSLACWQASEAVQEFMKEKGLTSVDQVRSYFEDEVQNIVEATGRTPIVWQEVAEGNYSVHKTTPVNVWDSAYTHTAASQGYPVIDNYGWYLDQQDPPGSTHYFWVDTWQNFFLNDPLAGTNLTKAQQELVLGGESSQWGEQLDATNEDSRQWPRACGAAERLWSPAIPTGANPTTLINLAQTALSKHRCTMVQRGIGAGPIRPPDQVGGFCPIASTSPFHNFVEM